MDTGTIRSLAGEQAAGADLLLVEGDPTRDITRLQDIREVVLAGARLERRSLLETPAEP